LPPAKPPDRPPTDFFPAVSFSKRRALSRSIDLSVSTGPALPRWQLYMTTIHEPFIVVGNFVVSPLVTPTDSGRFAASAVIGSGRGSGTHHRVLRFVPRFDTREGARRYAVDHGVAHASALYQQRQET
jgi:hypothetical protein